MKTTESAKYLNVLLNLMGLMLILGLFGFFGLILHMGTTEGVGDFIFILVGLLNWAGTMAMLVMLKRVVGTIIFSRNPFVEENIIRFKRLAYIFFALAILDVFRGFMVLLDVVEGPYRAGFLVSIFMGCVILVLADVFKFAIEIKNDNDLTV
ncbi:MAG: DUF2975 domain-containing protein [Clostridiaceae bacterium]|nr:DUF2975 domain-containing protein [Clostridiaceae bacterium]